MNLVIERKPGSMFITDSCENGIGGFSLKIDRADVFKFPAHLKGWSNDNVLECLAEIVSIWVGTI